MKRQRIGMQGMQWAAAIIAALTAALAHANPVGPQVVNGQASFATRGSQLAITNTPGTIINWQQFSIGAGETTRFIQQSVASSVLNRVIGVDPSIVLGTLQSNGRVFLLNPNGILFGAGSTVDVAGLVASTLRLSNEDFLAGRMNFTGEPALASPVINQGRISANSVYLVGAAVDNQGVINTPGGDVVLAAGKSVRVTSDRSARLQVEIVAPEDHALNLSDALYASRGIYSGLVRNSGTVTADSVVKGADGSIVLKASRDVALTATSAIAANGKDGGSVVVEAQQGITSIQGAITAAGSDGAGGNVAITGARTALLDGSRIDASGSSAGGSVRIGGDLHGASILDGTLMLRNSQFTSVAAGAQMTANARGAGNGGKVIVWADDTTSYLGAIFARGGAQGGNGGFVEVSGKGLLDYRGTVDVRAPSGATGTLLLDPTNIFIALDQASASAAGMTGTDTSADTGTGGNPNTFAASGAVQDSLLTTANLDAALATANVIVTTANPTGTGAGNITVVDPVSWAMTNTLTLTAANNIAINAGITTGAAGSALILNAAGAVTQTAAIGGAGGLVQNGAGSVTLSQANTYTGPTTVNAGTLILGASNAIANSGSLVVNGGSFDLGASTQTLAGVQLISGSIVGTGGTLTSTGNFDLRSGAVSAILGGTVGLDKSTGGTVTLSGANTYTGATTVSAGVLNLQNASAAGTTAGGVTVASGAALELQGGISIGNEALSIAGTGVGGNGALRNVSGDNTWSGTVTLTGAATIQSDANTLTLNAANAVTGAGQNLTLAGAGNGTISGTITTTTGTLTKAGAGTWTLSGANTYTGLTTVNAGTLAYGASNVIASGAVTVDGATAVLALGNNQSDTVGTVTVANGGSITGTGTSSLTTTGTYEMQSGSVSAILAGAVPLNKTTGGTVTLSGANTYTGATTVSAGVLNLQNATATGTTAGGVTVASGAALELQGGISIGNEALSIAGTGVGGNGALRNVSGNNTWSGTVTLTGAATIQSDANTLTLNAANAVTGAGQNLTLAGAGNGAISGTITTTTGTLTKTAAGTWTLSGANTYTGLTTVNAGTLAYGASNVIASGAVTVDGATAVLALGNNQSDTVGTVTVANGGSITGTGTSSLTTTGTYEMQSGSVSAILAGAVPLNKTTGGTVTLSGVNTYTGITTINAGTFSVATIGNGGTAGNLGAAPPAANRLVLGGGTLQYTGATAATNRQFTLTPGTTSTISVTNAATNLTMPGATAAASTGGLTKAGAGTLTLTGANTYTGLTTVNAGTLAYGASDVIASGAVTVDGATAVLALGNNQSDTVGTVTVANGGSITGSGTSSLTTTGTYEMQSGSVSAILAGAVPLNKTTGGTVTLSGVNTYTGITTISAGTLSVATIGNGGVAGNLGQATNAASNLVLGGGTLQYTGVTASTDRAFTLTAGTTSGINIFNAATNLTMSGVAPATTGGLTKSGPGTLTLTGANLYTGTTTINAGTLAYGASNVLASGPVTVDGATAVLALGSNQSDTVGTVTVANGGSITGTGTSTLTSTGSFEMQSGSVSAILGGAGIALNKTTAGTVTLSGANTYTGLTTVSAGVLNLNTTGANSIPGNLTISGGSVVLQQPNQIADTSSVVVAGGTLDIGANNDTVLGVKLTSGLITGTSGILTSLTNFDLQSGTVSAILGGNVGVDKTTAGTVTLTRTNTFTGATTVSDGTLAVTADGALGTTGAGTTVAAAGTLDFQNVAYLSAEPITVNGGTLATSIGTSTFAGPVTLGANSFVNVSGTQLTLTGAIGDGGSNLGITKNGAGTLVLSGAETYKGTTTVAAGTLALGASDRLDNASNVVVNGGTFDIGAFNEIVNGVQLAAGSITGTTGTLTSLTNFDLQSGTDSAILGGAVGVVKSTAGTVTLSAADTYTGATAINGGTLVVTNGNALGATGAGTTVASGATLNINNVAVVAEPVTLNGNGVGGVGALTATGTASLAGNVTLASASTIAAPAVTDALTLTGTINGPGSATLNGAGTITLGNSVGNATALASHTQNVALLNLNGGSVRTVNDQTYNATVVTGGATTLTTTANGNINMNGAINATAGTLTLDTGAGNATFNNVLNDFGTVQVNSGGAVSLVDANNLAIGNGSMNTLSARALAGNLTLAGTVAATGAGNSIVLAANGNFINTAGATALHPGPGRFLVWSTNPALDNRGGLGYNFKQYGATFGVTPVLDARSGFLYTVAPTVTPSLTGTVSKVYDGTTPATIASANYSFAGVLDGDTITLGNATNGTYDTQHVGVNKLVSIAGLTLAGASNGGATVYGYTLGTTSASANVGTITAAPLTVTANDQAKTYGNTFNFAGAEFTPAGLKNGETIGSVTLASAGAPATAHVAGGPYAITASAATGGTFTASDYAITYVSGTMTVNQAALTVTANDQVKAYGTPVTFTGTEFTSGGLKNGETIGSVTLTSAGAAPTASVMGSPYPILASAATGGTFTASDYAITYVPGTFTVNPAGVALTVTASNVTKTYGTTYVFTGSEFTATGLMNGETIGSATLSSPGAAANAPVAGNPYVITPTGVSGGTFNPANYTITYVNGTLTVVPAALTIRADNKMRFPGQPNPPFTATYTGFQLGETPSVLTGTLNFTTTANSTSIPGSYPIVASGLSSTNYAITYLDGALTVQTPASLLEGTWIPLLAALRRLGIEDFVAELADCTNSGTAGGTTATVEPRVAAKSRPRCGGSDSLVVDLPRAR